MALKAPEHVGRLVVVNGWYQPDPLFLRCFETPLAPPHGNVLMPFQRVRPLFL
jgi:aminoacrylate hydrolase